MRLLKKKLKITFGGHGRHGGQQGSHGMQQSGGGKQHGSHDVGSQGEQ